jgi:hypothetical protein
LRNFDEVREIKGIDACSSYPEVLFFCESDHNTGIKICKMKEDKKGSQPVAFDPDINSSDDKLSVVRCSKSG